MSGMRIRTMNAASLIIGVVTSGIGAAGVLLGNGGWLWATITGVAIMIIGYSVSMYVFYKFVIYKIRPLSQVVFSRDFEFDELEHHPDALKTIEEKLSEWAEGSRREIVKLRANEKFRKEYIGNVSHEIKTPIFNVQGYILTLLDGGLEDQSINRKYLERAEKSIERLINIVTDLDEISKLESGVLKLNLERFDIVALTREIIESQEMVAEQKKITLRIASEKGQAVQPIYVEADKHYVVQVIVNLLTNSIRYGVEEGMTEISFVDMFDRVMVEVTDNGVGIAREDCQRVFERFYRTDKARSREDGGTGLGLSIVKHILEAHGETIKLRSEVGQGSTFSFTLRKAAGK